MLNSNVSLIRLVSTQDEIEAVSQLWHEYWGSLGLPADFQNFSEEMAALPGKYAPPKGRLLIAFLQGATAGAAAFRPLDAYSCEAKRLYVRPQYRGQGIASDLLDRLVQEARAAGYRHMYGDTLPSMESALRLYRKMGFEEVAPYSANPTPGAIFLHLKL